MSRINRRRFTWVATSGFASAALVACSGDAVKDDITPTRIADVDGAPPTLAPNATPFSSSGDEAAADEGGGEAAAGGGGEPITVTGLDALAFDPESFEATPGQEIHFVNGGALQHDFVIDELDMATELLNGGDEQTITVPEDADYTVQFRYATSSPEPVRRFEIDGGVPDPVAQKVRFEPSGGFGALPSDWRFHPLRDAGGNDIVLPLKAGEHTIRMTNLGDGLGMDFIILVRK